MEAIFTIAIILIGLVISVAGLVGCIFPIIPGPPLSYIALLVLSFAKDWEPFSATFLIVMACLTGLVLILDYIIPLAGAKRYGASKVSVFCSVVGMVIGLFVFPPFGLFIGGFVGAMAGELYVGKAGKDALRAGWGVFVGNLVSIG
ncbi:MAG: DUF456 domain-containing protein, partial [Deltaproteobacteria bacterium]|nr:DUF456 domain-containing protein [Deltaproteobacteria bacterium]